MKKLIISTLAAGSLIATMSVANAGYVWNGFGWVWVPYCYWNFLGQYVCN